MLLIGTNTFKSQKEAIEHYRKLFTDVGCCISVKSKNQSIYHELMELIQRHPDGQAKIHNVVDFTVQKDWLNKSAFKLSIVRNNNETCSIAWRTCITGKSKSTKELLSSALRYTIGNQIFDFKNKLQQTSCEFCSQVTCDYHIDHVVHFAKLTSDFMGTCDAVPQEFATASDGSNRLAFKAQDQDFSDAWSEYHKQHAVLRVLCKTCNLKREKYSI